jgi:hypothetical protein
LQSLPRPLPGKQGDRFLVLISVMRFAKGNTQRYEAEACEKRCRRFTESPSIDKLDRSDVE